MTKVLIIEDDPLIATIYRSYLEKSGFQVEVASDGQTGFYRVHELRPDALLLDLMLPKMDGLQILRKIRAQKAFVKTPVLVFTNAFLPNMVEEAVQAGATQVYNKAEVTPRHMVEALNKALFPSALPGSGVTAAAMAAMQMAATAAAVPEPPPPVLTMVGQKPPPPPAPPSTPPVRPPPVPSGMVMPTAPAGRTEPPKPPRGVIPFPMAPVPPTPPAPAPAPAAKLPPPPSLPEESDAAIPEQVPYAAPSLAAAPPPPQAVPPPLAAPANLAVPEPAASSAGPSEDDEFLAELRDTFRSGLSGQLTLLRKTLQDLAVSNPGDSSRHQIFSEMYRRVHALTGGAGMVGLGTVSQLGTPLEALLRELCEKPKHPTPSILRTLHQAGQLMVEILASGEERNWLDQPAIEILAVDDEPISQRAIAYALKKAQLKCEIIDDPQAVGPWLATHRCDLIVVGADVPGVNLVDLAAQWRAAQPAPQTAVLHVIGPNDLESRLRACPPGDDCMAKPFLFVEMSVKALTMILSQRTAWAGV